MISPILTYNSEVWGAFVKSDFKSWDSSGIEKTHEHFCKRYLEVHNQSSNVACRAELGRFPLIIDINKKIINYCFLEAIPILFNRFKNNFLLLSTSSASVEFYKFTTLDKMILSPVKVPSSNKRLIFPSVLFRDNQRQDVVFE